MQGPYRRILTASFAFFLLSVFACEVGAQTFRGTINGRVTDPTGAAIPEANVKATNNATGVVLSTLSTGDGAFAFQDIPPGSYSVEITANGFDKTTVTKVNVTAGSVYTVPAQLEVGKSSTSVEVSAAAVQVDTTTATQTDTIPSSSVQNIPLNGRDFTQLIAVSPGYGGYSVGGFGSLNGTRANQMNWQIDGTDNNDFWHNIPAINQGGVSGIAGVVMPVDAIDEFSAQTQSNAETGRSAGGTINLTIKSGTNQIHGTAYYFNRNEFYAAASPFFVPTPQFPKAPELRNQNWGGSVGGPLVKNKTFLFLSFEKQKYIFGLTGVSTEPSQAWVNNALSLLQANSVPVSSLSLNLLHTLWPSNINNLPATTQNYFASDPGTGYSYNGVARLDHNFNDKEHLSVHWFGGQGSQTQPPGASLALATPSSNLGYYFEVAPLHVQNYSAVLNSELSPKFSNQLLFGVSYFNQVFHDANNSFNMAALGLNLNPGATIAGNPIMGASNIVISGFDQVGITPPEGRNDITGHLTDIVSYVVGGHQIRFGGEVRQGRIDEFYFRRSTGQFNFDGTQGPWAGSCASSDPTCALADFLAGDVSSSSIAVGNSERQILVNGFDFFAQDDWQITSKLNLNFGLRYEYFGPLHSNKAVDDLGDFVPGQGLGIVGTGAIPTLFHPDYNNFGPRGGFAYAPTSGLVVRGGFGVFFDQINVNPFLDFRPPISAADGLEDNPIGVHAVDNYSLNGYNWQTVQAGGSSIFPGVTTCLGNAATDPNCVSGQPYNVFSVNRNLRTPYVYNYNLNIEKSFGNSVVWQVGYVGSDAHKLSLMQNINQNGAFSAQYPNYNSIIQLNSDGTSNYNSLQTSLKINTWHGLTGQVAYTYSHALDEVTEYRGVVPFDSYNLGLDYGNSDFDTRHAFTAYWSYNVPGSNHLKYLTTGWMFTGLVSLHSGQPFNLSGSTQRPGEVLLSNPFSGVSHSFIPGKGVQWINPNALCSVGDTGCPNIGGAIGDVGRNVFSGPGFADVDMSVFKNFSITETTKLQLRAEMYNVFNRKNLASGSGSVGSNGVVSDTIGDFNGAPGLGPGEPFNLQIAAKFIF